MRRIFSVLAGLITGVVIISLVEMANGKLFPLPDGIDFNDKQALKQLMLNMPLGALIMVLSGWVLGSFSGGIVATIVADEKKQRMSLIVGIAFTIATIFNMMSIPHPIWMWVGGMLLILPAALLGNKMASK